MAQPLSSPLPAPPAAARPRGGPLPGVLVAVLGVTLATALHGAVAEVGVLTWAVFLGVAAGNTRLLPAVAEPGLRVVVRRLLRVGVVLLGLSLPLAAIVRLGAPVVSLVVVTLTSTLLVTIWLGRRLGLGRARSLLIGTGFAICGASAVAAMERAAEADEEDVASAVAMVTVWGSLTMLVLPVLQGPLGLSGREYGVWVGAGVHEVGQVVAAAGPAGAAAVSVAVVVKLTRVLLLAPVVSAVGLVGQRRQEGGRPDASPADRPPPVPLFVLGFLGCVIVRTLDVLPASALAIVGHMQTACLAAALFALGTGVRLASLRRGGGRVLFLGGLSTLVVIGVSLALLLCLL